MEKTRCEFVKTIGGATLGAGLLLAGGCGISRAWSTAEIPVYEAKPRSIVPLLLWTVEGPIRSIFTYLVDVGKPASAKESVC